jgi:hypothetical protein
MPPNAPVDPSARFFQEHKIEMDSQQRLQARVQEAVTRATRETTLFRERPELGEPDAFARAYRQFVLVNVCLNRGQIQLLPIAGRVPELERFTEEVRVGIETVAQQLHLGFEPGPGRFGSTGPIGVLPPNVPGGYTAALTRPGR